MALWSTSFFTSTPATSSYGSQYHLVADLVAALADWKLPVCACPVHCSTQYGTSRNYSTRGINESHHRDGFNIDDNEDDDDDNNGDDDNDDDGNGGGVELCVTPVAESHFPVVDYPGFAVQSALPQGNCNMTMEGPLSVSSDEVSDTDEDDAAFVEGDKIDEGKDNHFDLTKPVVCPSPPATFSTIAGTHTDNNYTSLLEELSAGTGATDMSLGLVMSDHAHIGLPDNHHQDRFDMVLPFYSQFEPHTDKV